MAQIVRQNQANPPLPLKKRVDKLGNDKKRCFLKRENNTFLFFKAPSSNAANELLRRIKSDAKALNCEIIPNFLVIS